MASPLPNQIVEDLKQNFFWSYISQDEEHFEIVSLKISVESFLEYIDINLFGTTPYTNELVALNYGVKTKIADSSINYYTFLITNSQVNNLGSIDNLGIINYPTKFLLLKENGVSEAIINSEYVLLSEAYKEMEIFSPYLNDSTIIDSLTDHPLVCYYPKEDFRNFILDNMVSTSMDLSTLFLDFQIGATFVSGVDSNYKVETPLVITSDNTGIRIDSINYNSKPFKYKALDVGQLCPPNCG